MFNFSSQLFYVDKLSDSSFSVGEDLLIYDQALLKTVAADFIKKFKHSYAVEAGEDLKSLESFPDHLKNILDRWDTTISRDHQVVAIGGGSVGDFAGFVASVLKRGVRLNHIPSTWLAAVDSAHGGKTALNVDGAKNQIGSFYPAEKIFLMKELLLEQPSALAESALGEVIKMSLIAPQPFTSTMLEHKQLDHGELVWQFLKPTVDAKYYFINQDPYEMKRIRKILNLGHTWGHVLEAYYKKPHGVCVLQGLYFSLLWSQTKKRLSFEEFSLFQDLVSALNLEIWVNEDSFKKIPLGVAKDLIVKDKKILSTGKMDFVFLKTLGQAEVETVDVEDILNEALEQGWAE